MEDLDKAIATTNVEDSIVVYELLARNKVEVPNRVKQSLLELVCYFNCAAAPNESSIAEREYVEANTKRTSESMKWLENGFADQLFEGINPKTDAAYNAIICGKAKYNQAVKAYEIYKKALEDNITLDVTTFNYIINAIYWVSESATQRWDLVLRTLHIMNEKRVAPNLQTLSDILFVISKTNSFNQARTNCLQILSEFKRIGIEPSLGIYYYVLLIFCRDRAPTSYVLQEILDEVEGKEWLPQIPADHYFFHTAMTVCRNHLADSHLGNRLNNLLNYGRNVNLLGDTRHESNYYRNYLCLLLETAPFDVFMEVYQSIVPHLHSPDLTVMGNILRTIDSSGMIEHLPRIWSDLIILHHHDKSQIISNVLNILTANKPIPEIASHSGLSQKFAETAWDIWKLVEEQDAKRNVPMTWTGNNTCNILFILCRSEDYDKANTVFEKCNQQKNAPEYFIDGATIEAFVKLCIAKKQPQSAIKALKYNIDITGRDENIGLAKYLVSSLPMSKKHLGQIAALVGDNIVDVALN